MYKVILEPSFLLNWIFMRIIHHKIAII